MVEKGSNQLKIIQLPLFHQQQDMVESVHHYNSRYGIELDRCHLLVQCRYQLCRCNVRQGSVLLRQKQWGPRD